MVVVVRDKAPGGGSKYVHSFSHTLFWMNLADFFTTPPQKMSSDQTNIQLSSTQMQKEIRSVSMLTAGVCVSKCWLAGLLWICSLTCCQ